MTMRGGSRCLCGHPAFPTEKEGAKGHFRLRGDNSAERNGPCGDCMCLRRQEPLAPPDQRFVALSDHPESVAPSIGA